jgi:dUTP pyrophosphatase
MPKLEKHPKGDWIDLRSRKEYEYKKGDFFRIFLGVGMKLPDNYEAHVLPRGGTFKNYGIIQTNSEGIIDNCFSGNGDEWFIPVYAMRDGFIRKYDRVAQFRIVEKMEPVILTEVEELDAVDRGGFSSTGVK